jgi:hypothetical protein
MEEGGTVWPRAIKEAGGFFVLPSARWLRTYQIPARRLVCAFNVAVGGENDENLGRHVVIGLWLIENYGL